MKIDVNLLWVLLNCFFGFGNRLIQIFFAHINRAHQETAGGVLGFFRKNFFCLLSRLFEIFGQEIEIA